MREGHDMTDIEIRSLETEELEFRAADPDKGSVGTFSGYAARYNSPSLPLPFTERIAPGAFARTLKSRNDVRMYVNHDDRMVLASTRSKTLRLEDRPDGLFVEADLPDVSYARDLRQLIEDKVVSTMSFGFSTVKDSWSPDGNERTLHEVRLHECSVVTGVAAYPSTTASVRNLRALAYRTETDAEALADAISALESGAELSDAQADVLMQVVDRSRPAGDPEPEPVVPLSILSKQIDLLAKQI
jgi:HK97 family phage prohead protease